MIEKEIDQLCNEQLELVLAVEVVPGCDLGATLRFEETLAKNKLLAREELKKRNARLTQWRMRNPVTGISVTYPTEDMLLSQLAVDYPGHMIYIDRDDTRVIHWRGGNAIIEEVPNE